MDHPQSQTQTQKDDFISSFFDENLTNGEMALDHQSNASIDQNQLNMDFIGNLMSMHVEGMPAMTNPTPMQLNSGQQHSSAPGGTGPALGSATVSQQFKLAQLQQLQQLQNQIFQQQIALISGGGPAPQPYQESNTRYPEHNQNYGGGLPTPGPSPDFVLYGDYQNREREPSFTPSPSFSTSGPSPAFDRFTRSTHSFPSSSDFTNRGTTSAPAHIAFSISDMEPDISPLTSPWLGGVDYGVQYRREQSQPISQTDAQPFPESHTPTDLADSQGRSRRKRAASSTEDEVARKKQSPAIRASNSTRMSSESSSSNPTRSPVIKAKRRSSKLVESPSTKALDSPSPVDMPPPIQAPEAQAKVNSTDASLQPVTPASMMNIGLGRGRVLKAILPSSKPLASSSSLPSTPACFGTPKNVA
ncbi:hypothetical protein C8J56DRAFT_471824 [Mycena floridula]|nr:hypothetical protein C8J56DRAFT_471824 [Mycena floridula]